MSTSNIDKMRHSTSHLMAMAILELFPKAKFGVGPTIENGFYYDVDIDKKLTISDLSKIEKKMLELKKKNFKFEKTEKSIDQAIKLFKKLNQPYKIELLKDIKKFGTTKLNKKKKRVNKVTIYKLGNFIDLCRGPHVKSTNKIGIFKLTKIAGAYWRGNEKNKMLQRIYGIAFNSKNELNNFLTRQAEAEKRDHRKLGKELDLFHIDEKIGPGLILWHPNGAILKKIVENYVLNEYLNNGYQLVNTPHIAKINLWETSGHTNFYKENMFPPMHLKEITNEEKDDYQIKPMNCPFHIAIYNNQSRSYRDLPIRYTELGTVYRYEKSGVLHGLTRARGFTQDDAHIFCTIEQLNNEIEDIIRFAIRLLNVFGFKKYEIYLSTKPKKSVGNAKIWKQATQALVNALKKMNLDYKTDKGGGAFYGPKIDIKIKDSLGRSWQCTTIQVDFNLPERFNMTYINNKGKKQRPIMIHRALLGSIERFIGILLEYYGGIMPVWLSPIQVYITPVSKTHRGIVQKLAKELKGSGIRTKVDILNETISYKIRKAEKQKIPYILVIGDKEAKSKFLNVRIRGKKKIKKIGKKQFIERILKEIKNKK